MLLLKKKKYAALTVSEVAPEPNGNGQPQLTYAKELKGLDLVRLSDRSD